MYMTDIRRYEELKTKDRLNTTPKTNEMIRLLSAPAG